MEIRVEGTQGAVTFSLVAKEGIRGPCCATCQSDWDFEIECVEIEGFVTEDEFEKLEEKAFEIGYERAEEEANDPDNYI